MRSKVVIKLASVLTVSQLRSTARGASLSRLRTPMVIAILDLVLFAVTFAFTHFAFNFASDIPDIPDLQQLASGFAENTLQSLPALMLSFTILAGLLFELSQSSQFASSDIINFLPISSTEYVSASVLSTSFIYSVILSIGLAITLAMAAFLNTPGIWLLVAGLSVLSFVLGSIIIEMLRAAVNRISSAFYRRSGRATLIVRLVTTVFVLVSVQIAFNPNFLFAFMRTFLGGLDAGWFIPMLWPSLTIINAFRGLEANVLLYSVGSVSLFLVMLWTSVKLRAAYWVPTDISVKVSSSVYAPRKSVLARLGFGTVELAIIRKDLRSMVRRREMARFLAVPVVIAIAMILPAVMPSFGEPSSRPGFYGLAAVALFMGMGIFSLLTSMTSIGQEGSAIWNIYSSPIDAKTFVRAKAGSILLISIPASAAMTVLISLFGGLNADTFLAALTAVICLAIEESFVGIAIGASFPDFSEVPRSRFITITGSILGMILGTVLALVIISPFAIYRFLPEILHVTLFTLPTALAATIILTAVLTYISYRLAVSQTSRLLIEAPT